MKQRFLSGIFLSTLLAAACAKSEDSGEITPPTALTPASTKAITSISFASPATTGVINETAKTISLAVPTGTNVTTLIASFTTTGSSVKVGATTQVSGITPNDFTSAKVYTVTAADASSVDYTVTVTFLTARTWAAVASSADGSRIIGAVGTSGPIWRSADGGATWASSGGTANYSGVAMSADGMQVTIAVTHASTGGLYSSADGGVTWAGPATLTGGQTYTGCSMSANGVIRACSQIFQVMISTNSGASWSYCSPSRTFRGVAVSGDGSRIAAVADSSQIYVSTNNCSSWVNIAGPTGNWRSITASANGLKLAAGLANSLVYYSSNGGASWTAGDTSSTAAHTGIASSSDGTQVIAVGNASQILANNAAGAGGWIVRDSSREWKSVASSTNGLNLVAVVNGGAPGYLYTSSDGGVTWIPRF